MKIDLEQIKQALDLLRAGNLVALPTETVYGLGADASNPAAIAKIFLAKERPFTHPLIVHLASFSQISDWARDLPAEAALLADAFWPGPLTLILKKQSWVSELVTGNQDSIGIRIPAHPVAQALLKAFQGGIAAPSANRYTHLSPTTAEAVRDELGDKVDLILEGGPCTVGIESTILDLSRGKPVILRPGHITAAALEEVLKQAVSFSQENAPRVAGMDQLHYAPDTSLALVASEEIERFLAELTTDNLPIAFMVRQKPPQQVEGVHWLKMSEQPEQYAHDLYVSLRALDKQHYKKIMVELPPEEENWKAVRDRLQKAAGKRD